MSMPLHARCSTSRSTRYRRGQDASTLAKTFVMAFVLATVLASCLSFAATRSRDDEEACAAFRDAVKQYGDATQVYGHAANTWNELATSWEEFARRPLISSPLDVRIQGELSEQPRIDEPIPMGTHDRSWRCPRDAARERLS